MKSKKTLGQELIGGLEDSLAFERGQKKLRTATVFLAAPPPSWSKGEIARLRKDKLHVSQTVFASLLAVNPATIRAWEQGLKKPSKLACRVLEMIDRTPGILSTLRGI